ncbi:MAG: triose-phosphate isomerase [Candidatus Hadarchaeales archaeon]
MLSFPLLVVNFKTYSQGTGEAAVKLARIIEEVAKANGVSAAIAVQPFDVRWVAKTVDIPVLAQHLDPVTPGSNTGWLLPEAAKEAGAVGSLLNHSERPLDFEHVAAGVKRLHELGMVTIVCAKDAETAVKLATLNPEAVAVEPPELIGTGRAVSKVKPEVVSESVKRIKTVNPRVRVLCGAGVSSGEDAALALKLGAEGVLLASYVVCAKDQRAAVEDIIGGMLSFKK